MIPSKIFPLTRVNKRNKTKFILITTISNLSETIRPMTSDIKGYTGYYVFDKINNYFKEKLEYKEMPMHYHVSQLKNNWIPMVSAPLDMRSEFLKHSVEYEYLPFWFRDAVLITVQDDFKLRIPDDEMYKVISSRILSPVIGMNKSGNLLDSVFWLDEVFNFDKYNSDKELYNLNFDYKYDIKPMLYFDRVLFNLAARKYL